MNRVNLGDIETARTEAIMQLLNAPKFLLAYQQEDGGWCAIRAASRAEVMEVAEMIDAAMDTRFEPNEGPSL
jgi:hypothetical protein